MKHPAGCNEEKAIAYMGCSPTRFSAAPPSQQMAKAMERYWSLIEEAGESRMRFAK